MYIHVAWRTGPRRPRGANAVTPLGSASDGLGTSRRAPAAPPQNFREAPERPQGPPEGLEGEGERGGPKGIAVVLEGSRGPQKSLVDLRPGCCTHFGSDHRVLAQAWLKLWPTRTDRKASTAPLFPHLQSRGGANDELHGHVQERPHRSVIGELRGESGRHQHGP